MTRLPTSASGVAGLALLYSVGCAGIIVPAAPGALDEPRASWSIRAGEYGSEKEVCRSDRDQSCVLPASSDNEPTSVVVSVYMFPAGERATTYRGAFLGAFLGLDGGGSETKVDFTIQPGQRPYYVASVDRVTTMPGNYEFRIALLADVAGRTDPHQFEETIPVRVVAASVISETGVESS